MRSLFLLILIIGSMFAPAKALATVLAETSLWLQNKFSNRTCQDLNQNDYQRIQNYLNQQGCALTSNTTGGQPRTLLSSDMNAITEYQFFNSLALKNLAQLDCKISSIDQFSTDDSLIEMRSQEIFDKLPFIKEQRQLANDSYHDYLNKIRENNSFASTCGQATGEFRKKCYKELDQARALEKEVEKKWQTHRALALSFTASLWNGSTDTMSAFIEKLTTRNPLPSKEVITAEFKKQLPLVKNEIATNKDALAKQSSVNNGNRVFDNLTDVTKRQLLESSLDDGLFTQAHKQKDDSMIKLLCRLEGQYTKGRDKLNQVASTSTFVLGGFAGLLAKIPVAVRAGPIASVLSKTRESSAIVGALATGIDAAVMANSIHTSCLSNKMNFTVHNTCPKNANEVKQNELQKFEQDNCILNAALGIAPVGVLAASAAYKSLSTVMEKYKEAYYLSENKKLSDILKTDALLTLEKHAHSLTEKPIISSELFAKNQQQAEKYFQENQLKVSSGKTRKDINESEEFASSIDLEIKYFASNKITPNERQILASSKNHRKVFTFDEVPKANIFASGASPFWMHPEFRSRFEEAKKMGVTILLDPQKSKGALYNPNNKSIYLNPNAPFHFFEHEFTHAQFDHFLFSKISNNGVSINTKFREGTKLQAILPEGDIQKIGSKNITYMQGLLEKYNSINTINESMAVKKQLQTMGWNPISSDYFSNKMYGASYRITELLEAQKAASSARSTVVVGAAGPISSVEFTAQQAKLLDHELTTFAVDGMIVRSSREIQNQIAGVRKNIANGNIPMALATWRKVQDQLQKQEPDNTTYFYNENGGFIRMNSKESRFEYTNLNSQKPK